MLYILDNAKEKFLILTIGSKRINNQVNLQISILTLTSFVLIVANVLMYSLNLLRAITEILKNNTTNYIFLFNFF